MSFVAGPVAKAAAIRILDKTWPKVVGYVAGSSLLWKAASAKRYPSYARCCNFLFLRTSRGRLLILELLNVSKVQSMGPYYGP